MPTLRRPLWPSATRRTTRCKALTRALNDINGRGWAVAGAVIDRWSVWRQLLRALIAVVTLGFLVRGPNVILVVYPIGTR